MVNKKFMKNIAENFQSKCKNCDHSKADHYNMVLDPVDNPKAKAGNCGRENCNCKKFEPKESTDNPKEENFQKSQRRISVSEKIMNVVYGPDHAEINDEQYQRHKKLYLSISNKLNNSLMDDIDTIVALSVISLFLFQKRNIISINNSSSVYCKKQVYLLPLRAQKFFPEIPRWGKTFLF